jgi:hypothetical protein
MLALKSPFMCIHETEEIHILILHDSAPLAYHLYCLLVQTDTYSSKLVPVTPED